MATNLTIDRFDHEMLMRVGMATSAEPDGTISIYSGEFQVNQRTARILCPVRVERHEPFLRIPEILISEDTLIWLGFSTHTASHI